MDLLMAGIETVDMLVRLVLLCCRQGGYGSWICRSILELFASLLEEGVVSCKPLSGIQENRYKILLGQIVIVVVGLKLFLAVMDPIEIELVLYFSPVAHSIFLEEADEEQLMECFPVWV